MQRVFQTKQYIPMRTILIFLITIVFNLPLIAQQLDPVDYNTNVDKFIVDSDGVFNEEKLKQTQGSPFDTPNFLKGEIMKFDGTILEKEKYYRYNIFNDLIQETNFSGSDISTGSLIEDSNTIVVIGPKKYIFIPRNNKRNFTGYFQILVFEKDFLIVKKSIAKYYDVEPAKNPYEQNKPAKFEREDEYYFIDSNNKLDKLPLNKKRIITLFPEKESSLKSFIKKNKLKFKEDEDYFMLGDFFKN